MNTANLKNAILIHIRSFNKIQPPVSDHPNRQRLQSRSVWGPTDVVFISFKLGYVHTDQFRILGNLPPTPPLSQHLAPIEK